MNIQQNIILADYTSWLIGGPAEYFCIPTNLQELQEALAWAEQKNLKVTFLGGGSNVLIADEGVRGLVICLRRFSGTTVNESQERLNIEAWAGTAKSELLKIFLKYKLAPALFLAGLPGDVGGGIVMNAGIGEAWTPREFVEIVDWVEVMRQENNQFVFYKYTKNDLNWSYRHCDGWQPGVIVRVGMSWPLEPDNDVLLKVREANKNRLSKQPLDMPSCGSVFKNPSPHKAAQLIDSCGLKGYKIGAAQVSEKHANFIVNCGQATATDTWNLILHVQKTVFEKTHIQLNTEVIRLGF